MVNIRDLASFRTFVRMCAARTSQQLNLTALANDCGISSNTVKGWLTNIKSANELRLSSVRGALFETQPSFFRVRALLA
jgi:predicted AAA+ superfamily ATPase